MAMIRTGVRRAKTQDNTVQERETPGMAPHWLETQARVTGCRYEFARLNTLTFGIPPRNNRFLISFSYYAHAKSYNDEFSSPVAMDTGQAFTVCYNPRHPAENSKSTTSPGQRSPLLALGIIGSVVLSLMYLGMIYGCG
jgi:hypothetical protein